MPGRWPTPLRSAASRCLIEPLLEIRHLDDAEIDLDRRAGPAVHQRQRRARLRRAQPAPRSQGVHGRRRFGRCRAPGRLRHRRKREGRYRGAGRPGGGPAEGRGRHPVPRRRHRHRRRPQDPAGGPRLPGAAGAALRGEDRHRPLDRNPRQFDAGRHRCRAAVLAAHRRDLRRLVANCRITVPGPDPGALPQRRGGARDRQPGLGGGGDRRPAGLAIHAGPGGCCPEQRSRDGRAIPAPRGHFCRRGGRDSGGGDACRRGGRERGQERPPPACRRRLHAVLPGADADRRRGGGGDCPGLAAAGQRPAGIGRAGHNDCDRSRR